MELILWILIDRIGWALLLSAVFAVAAGLGILGPSLKINMRLAVIVLTIILATLINIWRGERTLEMPK